MIYFLGYLYDYKLLINNYLLAGYGLSQDFKILKHTFPYINTEEFVQIIDLQNTMDKVQFDCFTSSSNNMTQH